MVVPCVAWRNKQIRIAISTSMRRSILQEGSLTIFPLPVFSGGMTKPMQWLMNE
jgi:hypothetical protein